MVHVDLPGLRQEDIHVNVEKGLLSISGERNDEHQSNERGVYRRERSYGSFRRNIALPDNVDPAGIKANFQNGVLEISVALPKEDRPQSRSIPVQSESSPPELKH